MMIKISIFLPFYLIHSTQAYYRYSECSRGYEALGNKCYNFHKCVNHVLEDAFNICHEENSVLALMNSDAETEIIMSRLKVKCNVTLNDDDDEIPFWNGLDKSRCNLNRSCDEDFSPEREGAAIAICEREFNRNITRGDVIAIVNGEGGSNTNSAILTELGSLKESCTVPYDSYPGQSRFFVSNLINGSIIGCGGKGTKKCYRLDLCQGQWHEQAYSMLFERDRAVGTKPSDDKWVICGGTSNSTNTRTCEMFLLSNQSFVPLPDLPKFKFGSPVNMDLVSINETSVVVFPARGIEAYILHLDPASDMTWIQLANAKNSPPKGQQSDAGTFTSLYTGNPSILLETGENTEILDLGSLDNQWKPGPKLPKRGLSQTDSVRIGDSFIFIGGKSVFIYEFDNIVEDWIKRPERLKTRRTSHDAFSVPKHFLKCCGL